MAEKRWIKSKEHEDLLEYKHINTIYKKHLNHAKETHILYKLNDNKNKAINLYSILRSLTKQKEENPMPPTESPFDIPNIFADFFLNKYKKSGNGFMARAQKSHIMGNAQDSLVSCLWKKRKYSSSSKIWIKQPASLIPAILDFY